MLFAVGFAPQDIYYLGLLALPFLGLGISWKWPLVGGILMILVSLMVLIFMIFSGAMIEPLGIALTLLMFMPILASGILFILGRK